MPTQESGKEFQKALCAGGPRVLAANGHALPTALAAPSAPCGNPASRAADGGAGAGVHRINPACAPALQHKGYHSGGLPVTQQIADQTDELSFLLWPLGVMAK